MALSIAQIVAVTYPAILKEMRKVATGWSDFVRVVGPVQPALPFTHEDWPEAVPHPNDVARYNDVRKSPWR